LLGVTTVAPAASAWTRIDIEHAYGAHRRRRNEVKL
jgi:hypothetical protein